MVDLTRRKTVIGLGLLATGSGATFTQAAFASQVSPASDMRVVVGQEFDNSLLVRAGSIFRDGDGNFQGNPSSGAVETVKNLDRGNGIDFFQDEDGQDDRTGLKDITVDDLPAAGADDKTNGDLDLKLATKIGEVETIGDGGSGDNGFIEIVNNTPDDHRIGIRFADFGADVDTGQGGAVTRQQVFETYKFRSARTNKQISPDGFNSDGEQNLPNKLRVNSGTTEQIYLEADTKENADSILDATNVEDSPFTEKQDTVDLVDNIRVGTTAESIDS